MRRPLVVGNWKMNGTQQSIAELLDALLESRQGTSEVDAAVCAPHVYLTQVAKRLSGSSIQVGAQDLSEHNQGAYTGDISAKMLVDVGCHFVLVGHSERRQYHEESNELVAAKFVAAHAGGLTPILCVGESLEQREANQTLDIIAAQMAAVMEKVSKDSLSSAVIAYEPVWAIGTGRTASPEQAQEVHSFIRQQLGAAGQSARLLYGGSVNGDNAAELFAQKDIDGGLVGGASLDANSFMRICRGAEQTAE